MKKTQKKVLSLFLCAIMAFSCFAICGGVKLGVSAEETEMAAGCSFDEKTGVLTINCKGYVTP